MIEPRSRRRFLHGAGGLCLGCLALGGALVPPTSAAAQGSVLAYGAFRDLMQRRDFGPKVQLAQLRAAAVTEAVGTLSGLRGEVTMIDGHEIVSLGPCEGCGPAPDTAALMVAAGVSRWRSEIVPLDVPERTLRGFIAERARANGVDLGAAFPFRFRGTLQDVLMHVNGGPDPRFTGHGSPVPMAVSDLFRETRLEGEVVGFHASATMVGIISHAGDPLHCHWVSSARGATAHLDEFGLVAGGTLLLPVG